MRYLMILFILISCSDRTRTDFVKVDRINCKAAKELYEDYLTKEQSRLFGESNVCYTTYPDTFINRNEIQYMTNFHRHQVEYKEFKKGHLSFKFNIPYCKVRFKIGTIDVLETCDRLK